MIRFLAARFDGLSRRERWLLVFLGYVVLPLVFLQAVVVPLDAQRGAASEARATAAQDAEWYLEQRPEIAAARATRHQPAPVAPVGPGAVERLLVAAGLRARTVDISSPSQGRIELGFRGAPFGDLMVWLETLEREGGYRVEDLRVSATEAPGIVDAEVRAGAMR